jgi:SulP family sulfate permease
MTTYRSILVPKLATVFREGYGLGCLRADAIAGLTVAIVALPLAMAIAIASGATPAQGLVTAIVGGFLVSALGGSRFQIGGPTAAFIVVVLNVILDHGYDGMLLATLMAGMMLILAGLLKLGSYVKYVPYPVITGFTSGIAATIFLGQLKELLGFDLSSLKEPPRDVVHQIMAYASHIHTLSPQTILVGLGTLGLMLFIRRYRSRWPVFLIGAGSGAIIVWISAHTGQVLDVATIHSRFGDLPAVMPTLAVPDMGWTKIREVFPSSLTIAFLAGVEALLSAVVADGMTGRHHRSNMELAAQGVANCASAFVGGLPVTGAIARTATNIRSGGKSPVSGMLHAVFLLVFLLVAAPLAGWIPLASLAAILVIVAWNISEVERFRHLLHAPVGDRVVLVSTFLLTVFVDLAAAIATGVIMASLLFMHRMSEIVAVRTHQDPLADEGEEDPDHGPAAPLPAAKSLPKGVEVYQINGPFFFGAASRIADVLDDLRDPPRFLILRMRGVPMMDASGAASLISVFGKVRRFGGQIILAGLQPQPRHVLRDLGIRSGQDGIIFAPSLAKALEMITS